MPMPAWLGIARTDTDKLGIRQSTYLALRMHRIPYVGTLLLYTDAWLARHCSDEVMEDLRSCLRQNDLRLPTADELVAAKTEGFWVELPDRVPSQAHWNLRVARELVRYELVSGLFLLRGPREDFFPWAKLVTLGDLLDLTEGSLRKLWRDYVLIKHVNGDAARIEALSREMHGLLIDGADVLTEATMKWVESAGLELSKQQ